MNRLASSYLLALATMIGVVPGVAQTLAPKMQDSIPLSAWEAVSSVDAVYRKTTDAIPIYRPDYPKDSIRSVVVASAKEVLSRLNSKGRSGLQLDGYGRLFVTAGMDSLAKQQFAERLGIPGLSAKDKAYTLVLAVQAFADPNVPTRLRIAEQYLAQLKKMGPSVIARQLYAKCHLIRAYYQLNQPENVIRHGLEALAMAPVVPYAHREILMTSGWTSGEGDAVYPMILDALKRRPNSQVLIDSIHSILRRATIAPADSVAMDEEFVRTQNHLTYLLDHSIKSTGMVGEQVTSIISNYWINTSDTSAHARALNDGKIRLLEFGGYGCGPCVVMFTALQRIRDTFGDKVEPIIVTHTDGWWANRIIEAEEESRYLKEYYLKDRGIKYPIALYQLPKITNEEGDIVPNFQADPNYQKYPLVAKPTTYLVDGTGRVRRVFFGYSREIEQQMVETVRGLL